MIKGVYRFYQNNELMHEQENALTIAGRSIVIKSLLGIIPSMAGSIGYGISEKPNTMSASSNLISDNNLQFQIGRTQIVGSSLNLTNNNDALVYSATITDPFQYKIYEVGLFPISIQNAIVGIAGSTIFDFDRVDNFIKYGTASGAGLVSLEEARIGTQLFYVPPTDGVSSYLKYSSTDSTLSDIDTYVSEDTFRLAGFDTNLTAASINFRFYTDASNYFDFIFPTPTSSGYFISEIKKGSATIQGAPSWENITSVNFWQNSSSAVYLDGLRIDLGNYALDTVSGMISRAVLTSPVRKPSGIPITIEYSLVVDFNYGIS